MAPNASTSALCPPAEEKPRRRVLPVALRVAGAVASGLLLASAFPPVGGEEAAWVALVPLLLIARFTPPRASFKWGFVAGLAAWLPMLAWLLRLAETGGHWSVVGVGWLALSTYCALYTAVFTFGISFMWTPERTVCADAAGRLDLDRRPWSGVLRNIGMLAAAPLLWVGCEYVRSVAVTGFPWNALGISQYQNLSVIQVAEWTGVYGVSAMLVLMNCGLTFMGLNLVGSGLRRKRRFNVELAVSLLACLLVWVSGVRKIRQLDGVRGTGTAIRVAAVQPNIPQTKKWPPGFAWEIMRALGSRTDMVLVTQPDLVVWPETAVPGHVPGDPDTLAFIQRIPLQAGYLLTGAMEERHSPHGGADGPWYCNSSFLFDSEGNIAGRYRKRHLVPFGEYLPLDEHIDFMARIAPLGFSCRAGETQTVFELQIDDYRLPIVAESGGDPVPESPNTEHRKLDTVLFSVLICFEDVFAYLARAAVRGGAQLLVNQTNDAWFDGSSASVQHLSHCVFRCVENRVPAVRCANTGVTCFIDDVGRLDRTSREILERNEAHLTEYRTWRVAARPPNRPLTFYARYGDACFGLPCGVFAVGTIVFAAWKQRKKRLPGCPDDSQTSC